MIIYSPIYIANLCFRLPLQYFISFTRLFILMTERKLIDARTAPARVRDRVVSLKPRRRFGAVIQTLILLTSLTQALPLPTDSNGPPLWPDKHNVTLPIDPPQTGDLPIPTDVYHRIKLDTSSRQFNMTSLYNAPISTAPPPDMFQRKYHPVSRKYFLNVPDGAPLPTNKCVSPILFYVDRLYLTLPVQVLLEPIS